LLLLPLERALRRFINFGFYIYEQDGFKVDGFIGSALLALRSRAEISRNLTKRAKQPHPASKNLP